MADAHTPVDAAAAAAAPAGAAAPAAAPSSAHTPAAADVGGGVDVRCTSLAVATVSLKGCAVLAVGAFARARSLHGGAFDCLP